ncbi:MAG: MFS transporter, partial [Oscillospiraceae bacterium]|nr:MFS transporter [Oscillospiraceae bacterium]
MKLGYKHTMLACYVGYITQAVINNLAPLLFVVFQDSYGLTFEMVGRLVLLNFATQLVTDLLAAKYADRLGYRRSVVLAHFLAALGLVLLVVLPRVMS